MIASSSDHGADDVDEDGPKQETELIQEGLHGGLAGRVLGQDRPDADGEQEGHDDRHHPGPLGWVGWMPDPDRPGEAKP